MDQGGLSVWAAVGTVMQTVPGAGAAAAAEGDSGVGGGLHSQAVWNSRLGKYQMAFNEYCFD